MKSAGAKNGNQFAAILQARQKPTGEDPVVASPAQRPPEPPVPAMGRPGGKGKKRDPNFRQVTAYIPRQLHDNATIALRLANQDRVNADKEDFSELLTRLLAGWFERQTFYRPDR
jgi:hypothetical protein